MKKYVINHPKLQPTDVILTRSDNDTSKVVRKITGGLYSHAMICVSKSVLIEADEGVYSYNPQRLIFDSPEDITILRFKDKMSDEQIEKICNFARGLTGSLYDIEGARSAYKFSKTSKKGTSRKQLCSRLVAQAYNAAGFKIVNNVDFCTPRDIHESIFFVKVTGCICEATEEHIEFAMKNSPIRENQRRTFQWLNNSRKIAFKKGEDIQTINDAMEFVKNHPDSDEKICMFIKQSGYLEHYNADRNINPYRYDVNKFLCHFYDKAELKYYFYQEELAKDLDMIGQYLQNYWSFTCSYYIHKHGIFKLHKELFYNLLVEVKERLIVLKKIAESLIHLGHKRIIEVQQDGNVENLEFPKVVTFIDKNIKKIDF